MNRCYEFAPVLKSIRENYTPVKDAMMKVVADAMRVVAELLAHAYCAAKVSTILLM